MANTLNFGWEKPDVGGSIGIWGGIQNASLDAVDADVQAIKDTADAALPATGGTMSGGLVIAPSAGAELTLNRGIETNNSDIVYNSLGALRARAGIVSDVAADYRIRTFDDAGVGTNVLTIDRASHLVSLSDDLIVAGDLTVSATLNISAFAGDGSQLTNLNASQLLTGTVPDGRFPATMDGPDTYRVAGAGGSESIPAYSFAAAVTTGMYQAGGVLGFTVSGTEKLRVSTGLVWAKAGTVFRGDGSEITALAAAQLTGTAPVSAIPNLDANKITSGSFDSLRLNGSYTDIDALTTSGLATLEDLKVGGQGTPINRIQIFQFTLSGHGSLAAGAIAQQTFNAASVTASSRLVASIHDSTSVINFTMTEVMPLAGQIRLSVLNAGGGASNPDGTVITVFEIDPV